MIQNLLTNWKTSSAGLVIIAAAVVHLAFHHADESTWTSAITSIVAGIGLIAAGDAASSSNDHAANKTKLDAIEKAVVTGDTTQLQK